LYCELDTNLNISILAIVIKVVSARRRWRSAQVAFEMLLFFSLGEPAQELGNKKELTACPKKELVSWNLERLEV